MANVIDPTKIASLLHKDENLHRRGARYLDTLKSDWEVMLEAVEKHADECTFVDWGRYTIEYSVNNFGDEVANFQPASSRFVPCGSYPVKQITQRAVVDSE